MGKAKIRINIDFGNSDGETETHQVEVEVVLPEFGPKLIDNVEKAILKANKEVIRQALVLNNELELWCSKDTISFTWAA